MRREAIRMHNHSTATSDQRQRKRLTRALYLAAGYMFAEALGGWLTGSLALLADAGHMLSDAAALGLSLFALWVAQRPPTPQRSYGYYRTEILAALAHGAVLITVALFVGIQACERIAEPRAIHAAPMTAIAAGGLAVNLLGLWILSAGRHENLNVRGAWLHVLSDALGSVGVIVAGSLVWWRGWTWADPLASIAISLLIVHSAWALLREAVNVLMEGAPGHIDVDAVRDAILGVVGIRAVHDLHVWSIRSGLVALSCHAVVPESAARARVLRELCELLEGRFGIHHATIQVEPADFDACGLNSPHSV